MSTWTNVGNQYGRVLKRKCEHERILEINTDEYWKRKDQHRRVLQEFSRYVST